MTVGELLAAASDRFGRTATARFDAAWLLAATLDTDTAWLLAHDRDDMRDDLVERYRAAVERRVAGEPVPYITGRAGFYGRTFLVTPDVLVPRPETEQLVALALARLQTRESPRICDVGTGSGILAITLALARTRASVTAIDASAAALAVAAENATRFGVAKRIDFRCGDALCEAEPDASFDAIVANLPYVRTADLRARPDPTAFEPRIALDGGPDGLAVYRRLVAGAPRRLAARGTLLMEAGPDTAAELAQLAAAAFPQAQVSIERDLAGLERIVDVAMTQARRRPSL